ncbi:MAG TPA: alpha/beta hydrolase [Candidatus Limnocylindria bacterium]
MTFRRPALGILVVLLLAAVAYTGYVGYEGSRLLVEGGGSNPDCRTPDELFGWTYEAINYDIADDALLTSRNSDQKNCTYTGAIAGNEVVTDDGIRLAGWYVPAADGAGPTAATVVLVHGFGANKTSILEYGEALHATFNLVAFDLRNTQRSSGHQTTGGVFEQKDLRAIIDWLERTKHPSHLGVLGNSLGAATAVAESRGDPRVEALALDSMHTRMRYQVEQRLQHVGHPAYPGTWAVFLGARLRTGVDLGSVDAQDAIPDLVRLPVLLSHGTGDTEDLPERTEAFYEDALAAGVQVELHWCEGAGHNASAGMPVRVCRDDFAAWMLDFFSRTLSGA